MFAIRSLLLASVAFSLALPIQAQPVRVLCGNGETTTAGVQISSQGNVVFPEASIVCGTTSGPGLPDALNLAISNPPADPTPVINVNSGPQNFAFSAHLGNYSPSFDTCAVQVEPPIGSPWTAQPLSVSPGTNPTGTATVEFADTLSSGLYGMRLICNRQVSGQQIVVPTVMHDVEIENAGSSTCPDPELPSIMSPVTLGQFAEPRGINGASGGFGVPFGQTMQYTSFPIKNVKADNALASAQLRSWAFVAPAGQKGSFHIHASSGTLTMSISKDCPGKFRVDEGVSGYCVKANGNTSFPWSTDGTSGRCQLEPNQTYYLNVVYLDRQQMSASPANYVSTCHCTGANCFNECAVLINHTPNQ